MKLGEIARLLGGELSGDAELEITGVSGLDTAVDGEITFIMSARQASRAADTAASCVMLKEFLPAVEKAQLKVEDPQYSFALLLERFYKRPLEPAGVSDLAFISEGATLAEGVTVSAFVYVSPGVSVGNGTVIRPGVFLGHGVSLGKDCLIYPNVVLMDGTAIGDRVTIHAGTVVGSDGFGYLQRGGRNVKIPQVGGVVIGDDVEIGASVAIDRATTGNTVIGRGTKIDNLVQVAHNVTIGEDCIIVAQGGIAGSSRIGKGCVLGGQAAVSDHSSVEDGTVLAGRAGVIGDLKKGVYGGTPAFPHRQWLKASSIFTRLPELYKRIVEIEERLKGIQGGQGDDRR
jgi:UDP-3-O-[3-hydroxymyristoyl] glucosamine N-acyltransferase